MLKPVKNVIFLSVAISAFNASSAIANEWFEQQRSASDGSAYANPESVPAGMQGRAGPVSVSAKYHASSSWLDGQLSVSDGYSQPGAEVESAFQGVSLEVDPNASFAEQGRRITDGTTG
ncbi:MAG: hypothetical protein H7X91_05945 [Burkholderiales bacterium]|nr:hypothetical protein [Burkholderiales bacterium]